MLGGGFMIEIKTIISHGVAYGKAISIINTQKTYEEYSSDKEHEIEKFNKAIKDSINELDEISEGLSASDKEFVEVHKMLISDPIMNKEVIDGIKNNHLSAIASFYNVCDKYINSFKEARTTYLQERALDMEDIKRRITSFLSDETRIKEKNPFILVCDELYPSYILKYDKLLVGVIALKGGFSSHSAILCKSKEIPYVIIDDVSEISGNILIDTRKNIININPTSEDEAEYLKYINDRNSFETNDFTSFNVKLLANVTSNLDLDKVLKYKMNGVGLYRTELIFMNHDKPMSYEDQLKIYSKASKMLEGLPITFRTFDIGDDKQLSYIKTYHKGIDNYINNKEVFETQIKALLAGNVCNNIKIMFPMIETIEEYNYLKEWTLRIKKEMNISADVKIGMMLETKKAYMNIDSFEGVDFMSLGTNDLTKELYNISREEATNYRSFIKDLLEGLKHIVASCKEHNTELSICGELASIKSVVKRLYRVGIRNFSVSTASAKNLNDALLEELEE